MDRRKFIQGIGSAAALAGVAEGQAKSVSIVVEPEDAIANSAPARWAAKMLQESLVARGATVNLRQRVAEAGAGEICVLAAGVNSPLAQGILKGAGVAIP